jgi:hypothetical protein
MGEAVARVFVLLMHCIALHGSFGGVYRHWLLLLLLLQTNRSKPAREKNIRADLLFDV